MQAGRGVGKLVYSCLNWKFPTENPPSTPLAHSLLTLVNVRFITCRRLWKHFESCFSSERDSRNNCTN